MFNLGSEEQIAQARAHVQRLASGLADVSDGLEFFVALRVARGLKFLFREFHDGHRAEFGFEYGTRLLSEMVILGVVIVYVLTTVAVKEFVEPVGGTWPPSWGYWEFSDRGGLWPPRSQGNGGRGANKL